MRIRTARELGEALREKRKASGLDQATLAARIGVSRKWVIEVEHGKTRAAIGLILKALEALSLHVEIVGESPEPIRPYELPQYDINAIVDSTRGDRK